MASCARETQRRRTTRSSSTTPLAVSEARVPSARAPRGIGPCSAGRGPSSRIYTYAYATIAGTPADEEDLVSAGVLGADGHASPWSCARRSSMACTMGPGVRRDTPSSSSSGATTGAASCVAAAESVGQSRPPARRAPKDHGVQGPGGTGSEALRSTAPRIDRRVRPRPQPPRRESHAGRSGQAWLTSRANRGWPWPRR